jgi:hypothetical protein
MANSIYKKGRQYFLEGAIAYLSDNIKTALLDAGSYTPNLSTDDNLDDIAGGARVATSGNLASKSSTDGTADAADITFSAVTGAQCSYIVMYKDSGTESSSHLMILIDTATNLPVTPNGGDITIQWDNGTNKIFTLFEGLPESERGAVKKLQEWLRDVLRIPAEREGGLILIPKPRLILAPRFGA